MSKGSQGSRTGRLWVVRLVVAAAIALGAGYFFDPFGLFQQRVTGRIIGFKDTPFDSADAVTVSFVKLGDKTVPAFGREVAGKVSEGNVDFSVKLPPGNYKVLVFADTSKRKGADPFFLRPGPTLEEALGFLSRSSNPPTIQVAGNSNEVITVDLPTAIKSARLTSE